MALEKPANHRAKPADLPRYAPPQKKLVAIVVEAEPGGNAKRPPGRQIPPEDRRRVMRGIVQAEMITIAQAAVHFDSGNEILRAESAAFGGSLQAQGAACAK